MYYISTPFNVQHYSYRAGMKEAQSAPKLKNFLFFRFEIREVSLAPKSLNSINLVKSPLEVLAAEVTLP